ncbi:CPBP family intramembrane glutamic endopeptidase [Bacillus sp. 31A1R]|uniref:CPBP family intramembrane glutamic endopeptidase n=1 Tax=Robertmurraya mangrovi TaxID=3098077 RepID=A0ABU5IVX8_9BACI|nr:CPBP family intramembrane glutamic endopeptidase [Bacillus sp. 31A1R]MDZ5471313.1 CPBP family intramembrane glutamic endopeptidase [Bacillus sp. 31A1R]
MEKDFISINQGKNSWKRYILSFFVMLAFLFIGSIVSVYLTEKHVVEDKDESTYFDNVTMEAVNLDSIYSFVYLNMTYIVWIIGIFLAIRLIHKRSFKSLITPYNGVNWKRIFWGFAVFFGLITFTTLIDFVLSPSDYRLNDINFKDYVTLFLFVLILTPIQTTTEEVFFRGYLMQWIGKIVKNHYILSILAGLIFAALHFANPEMEYSAVLIGADYVLSGILWCFITARTNSVELTIGAHAANNMFLGWFLTMDNTAFGNIPSLFVVGNINPAITLMWTAFSLIIFTYLSIKKYGVSN